MTKAEEISAWLNGDKNYDTGCRLYDKYGASASLKRILSRGGDTAKNKSALEYELKKMIRTVKVVSAPVIPAAPVDEKKKKPAKSKAPSAKKEPKAPKQPKANQQPAEKNNMKPHSGQTPKK